MTTRAWYVHLYVNGWYGGAYGPFPTEAAAEADYRERGALFNAIGCSYLVSESPGDPRPRLMRKLLQRLEAEAGTHA